MLKLNKYLRELGYNEESWPFNEIEENTNKFINGEDCDMRYVPDDGFVNAETFSMDITLAMIIYSYLCYFRDHCAGYIIPGCMMYKNGKELTQEQAEKRWNKTLGDMITAFKLYLEDDSYDFNNQYYKRNSHRQRKRIEYGMKQFIKYFGTLGW